jgi:hypothetical protein
MRVKVRYDRTALQSTCMPPITIPADNGRLYSPQLQLICLFISRERSVNNAASLSLSSSSYMHMAAALRVGVLVKWYQPAMQQHARSASKGMSSSDTTLYLMMTIKHHACIISIYSWCLLGPNHILDGVHVENFGRITVPCPRPKF